MRKHMPLIGVLAACIAWLGATAPGGDPAAGRAMLDTLQRECLSYIWEMGDAKTGLAYEGSFGADEGKQPLAVGGTGFGVAAIVVGVERGWLDRNAAVERLGRITSFLRDETPREHLHGAFPHWLHHLTGDVVPFSELDDGADIVETSLLMQGLLIARAYFDRGGDEEKLRGAITEIWEDIDWNWFTNRENNGLYWHWSQEHGFKLGMKIQGFNECLITYVLAASSPTHPISRKAFDSWTRGNGYAARNVYGYDIEAAFPGGGPLFFTHYSFIGLDPRRLADAHVSHGYYVRNVKHVLGNRGYCLYEAPKAFGYSPALWGLTASLIPSGYAANDPENDTGTVAPTAALSSMPYAPHYAMQMLASLLGDENVWGAAGPYDAINREQEWAAAEYLAIDQLPIVSMVENYRSGLLWRLFMGIPEILSGLEKAGMKSPELQAGFPEAVVTMVKRGDAWEPDAYDSASHPDAGAHVIPFWSDRDGPACFVLRYRNGSPIVAIRSAATMGRNYLRLPLVRAKDGEALVLSMERDGAFLELPIRLN